MDDNSVFLDEIGIKYMILSIFAHDPWHDFTMGDRVEEADKLEEYENIISIMNKKKIMGGNELISKNKTELIVSKEQIAPFIKELTVNIFGDGLLYILDVTNNLELSKNTNTNFDDNLMSFDTLYNKITIPAINKIENSELSSLSVVQKIYAPELLPLLKNKSALSSVSENLINIEKKAIDFVYDIVIRSDNSSTFVDTCNSFWDVPHALNKINTIIEKHNNIVEQDDNIDKTKKIISIEANPPDDLLWKNCI